MAGDATNTSPDTKAQVTVQGTATVDLTPLHQDIQENTNLTRTIVDRLDRMDLNGAAEYLRAFGYFLRDNPHFLPRAIEQEDNRQDWQATKRFFGRHLKGPRAIVITVLTFVVGGMGYALGGNLVGQIHVPSIHHFLQFIR